MKPRIETDLSEIGKYGVRHLVRSSNALTQPQSDAGLWYLHERWSIDAF